MYYLHFVLLVEFLKKATRSNEVLARMFETSFEYLLNTVVYTALR